MAWKTKWFGKKIKNKDLEAFLDFLNIDKEVLRSPLEKWSTEKVWGRYNIQVLKTGLNVDLYIFRKDVHYSDGSLPDLENSIRSYSQPLGDYTGYKSYFINRSKEHYTKEIPFEDLKNKPL